MGMGGGESPPKNEEGVFCPGDIVHIPGVGPNLLKVLSLN